MPPDKEGEVQVELFWIFFGGGAPDCLFLLELSKENVCNGGDHRGLVLTFPQLPQELKVHVYQSVQLQKLQANFNFRCVL